jgi:hypothetical protein
MDKLKSPREAFAYIAGYLDGEACIGYWCGYPELKIDTCNPEPLRFVSKHFGGTVKPLNRKTKKDRTVYRLVYQRAAAIMVLEHTVEFLHEKKKQAKMCLTLNKLNQALRADKKKSH